VTREAIVLGAGHGARMGGPKALLVIDGVTLIEAHAARLAARGYDVAIVVRAEHAARATALVGRHGARVVASDGDDAAASLAYGVRALPRHGVTHVLVTPVDAHPAVDGALDALERAIEDGARAATPRLAGGRGGHPILCRPDVLAPYRTARPAPPLRDVLRALGDAHARVTVDDPRILRDLDRPDDVAAITFAGPTFRR